MEEELESLKDLSPRERIKRLEEIKKRREKEIEDATRLLSDSEEELKEKEDIPIEQLKADSAEALAGETEKELFKMKRFDTKEPEEKEEVLEETLQREAPDLSEAKRVAIDQGQYLKELSMQPAEQLYSAIKGIQEVYQDTGQLNDSQRAELYSLGKAMEDKAEAIKSGEYNPSEYIRNEVDVGASIINKLMRDYER
jgi:hypothetical protein